MLGVVTHGGHLERLRQVVGLFEKTDWIRFSIDAGTNATYQDIHFHQSGKKARNTLQEILTNGRTLRESNPHLQLGYSYVIVPPNQHFHGRSLLENIEEIPLAAKLAVEFGFSYLSLKPCLIKGETEGETLMPGAPVEAIEAVTDRLRQCIDAARLQNPELKILESQNLLAMMRGELEHLRSQPQLCYAGFLRQVVTPSGIFHCPAWRGDLRARIGENKGYSSFEASKLTAEDSAMTLTGFNATKTCSQIACFYNGMNRYIEDIASSDEAQLAVSGTAPDTFL
jgi:hypothetical protein